MQSPHSAGIAFMSGKGNGHQQASPLNGETDSAGQARNWFHDLLEAVRVMQPITLTRGKLELDDSLPPPRTNGPEVKAGHHLKR